VTIPAARVTACCSAILTSNARSGKASIINFKELPDGIAGVTYYFFVVLVKSRIVNPTSWYLGGKVSDFESTLLRLGQILPGVVFYLVFLSLF
jgi:hypothetical protein